MMPATVNPVFGVSQQSFGTLLSGGVPPGNGGSEQSQNRLTPTQESQASRFYSRVPLPANLQGYVRYVVVLDPQDSKPYSIGIKYVCRSKGADEVLARLSENVNRRHKKRVHAWLCKSCSTSSICPAEWACPDIHVTPTGYSNRRPWTQALGPSPRKAGAFVGEDDDWSEDEDRPEDSRASRPARSPPPSSSGLPMPGGPKSGDAASTPGTLGFDPVLLNNTITAARAESSQLAKQLALLNLDLNHIAKVTTELQATGNPAISGATGPSPALPPDLAAPARSEPAPTPLRASALPPATVTPPAAAAPLPPSPAAAADVTQNIISILTSLNMINLLNQFAGTLTDPTQLHLIHQLAAHISSQVAGLGAATDAAPLPNNMLNIASLSSLLNQHAAPTAPAVAGPVNPLGPSTAPAPSSPKRPPSAAAALPDQTPLGTTEQPSLTPSPFWPSLPSTFYPLPVQVPEAAGLAALPWGHAPGVAPPAADAVPAPLLDGTAAATSDSPRPFPFPGLGPGRHPCPADPWEVVWDFPGLADSILPGPDGEDAPLGDFGEHAEVQATPPSATAPAHP